MADYNVLFGGNKPSGMASYAAGVQRGQGARKNELAVQQERVGSARAGITAASLADKTDREKQTHGQDMLKDKLETARNLIPRVTQDKYGEYVNWTTTILGLPQEFYADPAEVAKLSPQDFESLKTGLSQTADQFIEQSAQRTKDATAAGVALTERGEQKQDLAYGRETGMQLKREGSRAAKEIKTMAIDQKQREMLVKSIADGKLADAKMAEKEEIHIDIVKDLFGINETSAYDKDVSQNILDVADLAGDYMADGLSEVKAKKRAYEDVMGEKAIKKTVSSADISGRWTERGSLGDIKRLAGGGVPIGQIYKKLRKEGLSDEKARDLLGKAGFK